MNTKIALLSTIALCFAVSGSFSADKPGKKGSKMKKEKISEVDLPSIYNDVTTHTGITIRP